MNVHMFVSLSVAFVGLLVCSRLIAKGYYAALLPALCMGAYAALSVEWGVSGSGEKIGELKDVAWLFIESGMILGFSALAWGLLKDFESIGKHVKEGLEDGGD